MRNIQSICILSVIVLILNLLMVDSQETAAGRHGTEKEADKIHQPECF